MEKKVLFVVTNTSVMNDAEETKTGVWLEEFAVPFLTFKNLSDSKLKLDVTVASPLGGISPIDYASLKCKNPTEWDYTKKDLDNTVKLSDVDYTKYDAIFLPGGHGPMFDLAKDELLGQIVSYFYNAHKIVAAVCHGPVGLINAKTEIGEPIVKGMRLTCFTNEEEKLVEKDRLMPFMLESKLKQMGAIIEKERPWTENVVIDKNLITGQNPESSKKITEIVLKKLKNS